MAEYIERGRVLEILKSLANDIQDIPKDAFGDCTKNYINGWRDGIETGVDEIEVLPSADVRPKRHGVWLVSGDCYECSECGGGSVVNANPYCWKCGAKMDGKDE